MNTSIKSSVEQAVNDLNQKAEVWYKPYKSLKGTFQSALKHVIYSYQYSSSDRKRPEPEDAL
jgi:hypothetical protein